MTARTMNSHHFLVVWLSFQRQSSYHDAVAHEFQDDADESEAAQTETDRAHDRAEMSGDQMREEP